MLVLLVVVGLSDGPNVLSVFWRSLSLSPLSLRCLRARRTGTPVSLCSHSMLQRPPSFSLSPALVKERQREKDLVSLSPLPFTTRNTATRRPQPPSLSHALTHPFLSYRLDIYLFLDIERGCTCRSLLACFDGEVGGLGRLDSAEQKSFLLSPCRSPQTWRVTICFFV